MYTTKNYKSKKDLKADLASGKAIPFYNPGVGSTPTDGTVFLEGPHYPEPHKWYAEAVVKDGKIVKVK